jgi:hypothetical protein
VPKPTVGFVYNPPDPAPWNSDPGGNFWNNKQRREKTK